MQVHYTLKNCPFQRPPAGFRHPRPVIVHYVAHHREINLPTIIFETNALQRVHLQHYPETLDIVGDMMQLLISPL